MNTGKIGNVIVDSENSLIKGKFFRLPLYQTNFFDSKDYVRFIKGVEKLIRRSEYYSSYKSYLIEVVGLNYCSINPNINDDLEMHHGPILTLFDYCDIVTTHLIKTGCKDITTFKVANIVMQEHLENNVQVVMLSKTAHQLVHCGKIFINIKQAWGNLNEFIRRYDQGINDDQKMIINKYLELSKTIDTTDGSYMELAESFRSYSNNYNPNDILRHI